MKMLSIRLRIHIDHNRQEMLGLVLTLTEKSRLPILSRGDLILSCVFKVAFLVGERG